MPTYVYRREDGTTFEIEQRITEDPLETDPKTGQSVERIISGSTGIIFKGSGFYETDYVRKNGANGSAKQESADASAASSDNGSSTSTSAGTEAGDGTSSAGNAASAGKESTAAKTGSASAADKASA